MAPVRKKQGLSQPTAAVPVPPPPAPPASPEQTTAASSLPPPQPFQWSSLESEDYSTYIASLRKIGCPEQTIFDIISADLESLYTQRQTELSAQHLNSAELRKALESLRVEKVTLLNELLGRAVAAAATAQPSPLPMSSPQLMPPAEPSGADSSQNVAGNASVPLIFQPLKGDELKLTASQSALLEKLRQNFLEEIGGPNQSPNDPRYLEKWQNAAAAADQRVRSLLGSQFYIRYQLEARRYQAPGPAL
ncbi:MAG: hypothetical protein ACFUZC_01795 [Chthoniobacteraceae bacterium]